MIIAALIIVAISALLVGFGFGVAYATSKFNKSMSDVRRVRHIAQDELRRQKSRERGEP